MPFHWNRLLLFYEDEMFNSDISVKLSDSSVSYQKNKKHRRKSLAIIFLSYLKYAEYGIWYKNIDRNFEN